MVIRDCFSTCIWLVGFLSLGVEVMLTTGVPVPPQKYTLGSLRFLKHSIAPCMFEVLPLKVPAPHSKKPAEARLALRKRREEACMVTTKDGVRWLLSLNGLVSILPLATSTLNLYLRNFLGPL